MFLTCWIEGVGAVENVNEVEDDTAAGEFDDVGMLLVVESTRESRSEDTSLGMALGADMA